MHLSKTLFVLAALAGPLVAQSPAAPAPAPAPPAPPSILGFALTGSTTVGSQYIFRGLTQTDGKPTVQAELDLVHPTGFYLSTALSNISWITDTPLSGPVSAGVELDVFGGYKWAFAKDWTLDLGLYRYLYPGDYSGVTGVNFNTTEAYLGLSYSWASLKYSRVISGGKTTFNTPFSGTNSLLGYTDYKLGIAVALKDWTLTLAGTNADTKDLGYDNLFGRNIGKGRVTFTITKAF